MRWVDIGVNLCDSAFASDVDDVLARARAVGVDTMVVTGTSTRGSRAAVDLCRKHPGTLWATAGVHPHDAKSCTDSTIEELRTLAAQPEIVAIGECGLDFNRNLSPPAVQERTFEAQLELAAELRMPAFVHERDASARMLDILRHHRSALTSAVVHCFTGDEGALRGYLDLDLHIGITGWICDERRGTHLRELVRLIPPTRLMLETDAPYLLPRTIRPRPKQRRNEPSYLPYVAQTVAESLGIDLAALAEDTSRTARTFFAIAEGAGPTGS